jgi:His/Glu/Gln/Arg/opine family amino acid ABC transporter permease subunit
MEGAMIDTAFIQEALPRLFSGAWVTMQIAVLGSLIGFAGGIILGILQSGQSKLARFLVLVYVTIIRGTPMLLQIMFFSLVFTFLAPFWAAIIAIGINSSAYISQVVKSGIASVSKGQIEAAKTLGLSNYDITRYIVLPQALSIVLPALSSEFITLIKDSALASIIGVTELFKQGEIIKSRTYKAILVYILVGLFYLVITSVVSVIFIKLEHYYKKAHAKN